MKLHTETCVNCNVKEPRNEDSKLCEDCFQNLLKLSIEKD